MVRTDTTILFIDNNVEAHIGHTAFPGSGHKEDSDRAETRAEVLMISPISLDIIYLHPIV